MRREAALPALDDAPPVELVRDGRVSRTVPLSAVSEVRVSNVDKKSEPGELPVRLCNYTDVYKNDYITDDLEFMRATATRAEIARFGLRVGDVVITKDSETPDDIGIPSLVDEATADLVCGYHLAMIRPSPDKVDPTFLAKQLAQPRIAQYYGQQANGSTRYGLPMAAIERTPIWMPELAQQRGIGLLARQLDAAIERSSALIAKLKLARAGLLDDLLTFGLDNFGQLREPDQLRPTKMGLRPVTWKVGSLGQFVDKAEYGTNLSLSDVADGIPVLRMNNIVDGEFDLSDLRYGKLEGLDLRSLGGRDGSPSHVNLLTLHSAKGCEYDVVIMVGMDMGAMPWRRETEDELRESRRLFYVGLTRARDAVHMLYSGWIPGRYGAQRLGRSPFVEELEERLLAY
jgi:hypothetical protein